MSIVKEELRKFNDRQDITVHGKPAEGWECLASMDEITEENENYCEYQTYPSMTWHPAKYSSEVVQQLLATQYHTYIKAVQQADCKAELRRLLAKGPPIWIEDKHALPIPENGDTHVIRLWFASKEGDGKGSEQSAKLNGAVEGHTREQLWDELKMILAEMEDDKMEEKTS